MFILKFPLTVCKTYYQYISSMIWSKVDTYLLCLNWIPFLNHEWIENSRNTCTEPTHDMSCRISSPVMFSVFNSTFRESFIMFWLPAYSAMISLLAYTHVHPCVYPKYCVVSLWMYPVLCLLLYFHYLFNLFLVKLYIWLHN